MLTKLFKRKKDPRYADQISAAMSFSSIFSAMSVFFTGLIISNYNNFGESIRIPSLFLIVSSLGFMFATIIYANATGFFGKSDSKIAKAINIGDIVGEYFGVYLFLSAIPMVINVITNDAFFKYSVLFSIALGLIAYHYSGFSFTGLKDKRIQRPFLFYYLLVLGSLFFSQMYFPELLNYLAVLMLVSISFMTYYMNKTA
jgi:hypothetical protein